MNITVEISIPDDILSRRAVGNSDEVLRGLGEEAVVEAYKRGRLTHAQLGRLLGFSTPMQVDDLLKREGVELEYTLEDLEQDTAAIDRILHK